MARFVKIVQLVLIIMSYCLIIITTNCNNYKQVADQNTDEDVSVSTDLFTPSAISDDDSAYQLNRSPSSCLKFHVNKNSVVSGIKELILDHSFSRYILFAKNLIIRPQPTDFIFPHHYF